MKDMSRENRLFIVGVIILTCVMGIVMKVVTSNEVAKRLANKEQYAIVEEYYG